MLSRAALKGLSVRIFFGPPGSVFASGQIVFKDTRFSFRVGAILAVGIVVQQDRERLTRGACAQ